MKLSQGELSAEIECGVMRIFIEDFENHNQTQVAEISVDYIDSLSALLDKVQYQLF